MDASAGYSTRSENAFWVDADDTWDEASIPKRPWIVPGFLLRHALLLLIGAPGAGKSTLVLLWAISLALGLPIGRFKPLRHDTGSKQRRVLVINCEDDADEQRRRIAALIRQFGKKPSDLGGFLTRAGPEDIGALFERDMDTGKLIRTPAFTSLETLIADSGAEVVVLDPLIELATGADENSNADAGLIQSSLRSLAQDRHIAICIVHHLRKGSLVPGDMDAARGASSIVGKVRGGMTLVGMSEVEAEAMSIPVENRKHYVRLDDGKQNHAQLSDVQWFERLSIELNNGDAAPTLIPWTPPKDTITPEMRSQVEAGIARGSSEGPWSPQMSDKPRSVKNLMLQSSITTKDGMKKLLAELQRDGFVTTKFNHPATRKAVDGLRTPDGKPSADWHDDVEP